MRKVLKFPHSQVIKKNLEYKENGNNTEISQLLFKEQKGFCAYTETYLGRTDKAEIDHFNPIKNNPNRNKYSNLFLVKAKWNSEKSDKWEKFQPVLHPTSDDFEERIIYDNDMKIFTAKDENDIEAINLVNLLKLDDPDLATERKRYIEMNKELWKICGGSIEDYFNTLIQQNINSIQYIRTIQEEFNIPIWEMIPEQKQ